MNVVFLHSYAIEFARAGYEVTILDVGHTNVDSTFLRSHLVRVIKWHTFSNDEALTTSQKIKNKTRRMLRIIGMENSPILIRAYQNFFERSRSYLPPHVKSLLEQISPQLVFYFWSTTVRDKKMMLDCFFQHSTYGHKPKSILGVNTYPVRENFSYDDPPKMSKEDRNYFSGFDLVLLANSYMQDLFMRMGYDLDNTYIHDDRLSPQYFSKKRTLLTVEGKDIRRICFLGNTNFDGRTIDDIRWQLNELAASGFDVSIQATENSSGLDSRIKHFKPYSYAQMLSGEFSEFLSGFDAIFMGYNRLENARSCVSMPTRFALGMTGFLPILIEGKSFAGMRETFGKTFPLLPLESLDDTNATISHFKFTGPVDPFGDYERDYFRNFNLLIKRITEL